MNKDTYILQKDLPNIPAGTEVTWDSTLTWVGGPYKGGRYGVFEMPSDKSCTQIWTCEDVENNTEWFKLKEEEQHKEWQILSFSHNDTGDRLWKLMPNGMYNAIGEDCSIEQLIDSKFKINSVKRLSDGEVFTIGDNVSCDKCPESFSKQVIEKFIIADKGFMIASCAGVATSINNISRTIGQPKYADTFVWSDTLVKEYENMFYHWEEGNPTKMEYFKKSKSTPTPAKIEVMKIGSMKMECFHQYDTAYYFQLSTQVTPEKYEQISKAIEQTLNQ